MHNQVSWMFRSRQPRLADIIKRLGYNPHLRKVNSRRVRRKRGVTSSMHVNCKNMFGIEGIICTRPRCCHFLKSVPECLGDHTLPLYFYPV
jgi:hypothetical protein